jgi:cytochrome d ubiquinol oxidase subunit I
MISIDSLLALSAFGVYCHALFVSITLGFPVAIIALLFRYLKTGEEDYFRAAKVMTWVLALNFALGAITGTLVEFGLVQAWPGTILAIASFAFVPLALELLAFANEIAFLVLFIVTLGRIRTSLSIVILALYWIFAVLSGVLITAVNSWLVAPWGTGSVPHALYPFMPEFGENAADVQKLVAIKIIALASGLPLQAVIQNPEVAEKVGIILRDPYAALFGSYAYASALHNISAAVIVGLSIAVFAYALKWHKKRDEGYLKVVKTISPVILIIFLLQPTIFGHLMGEAVVEYNPTKFAMMEGAHETFYNPLISLVAYGDPSRPIVGFDELKRRCEEHGDKKLGDLALAVGLSQETILRTAKDMGVDLDKRKTEEILNLKLREICLSDVSRAEARTTLVHYAYYTKIAFGIIGFVSAICLFAGLSRVPLLSRLVLGIFKERVPVLLSFGILLGSVIPSVLGWYVREVGRKPWTVYGLLYPEELVSVVGYARSAEFALFMGTIIAMIVLFGIFCMYIIATRQRKSEELIRGGGNG